MCFCTFITCTVLSQGKRRECTIILACTDAYTGYTCKPHTCTESCYSDLVKYSNVMTWAMYVN